MRAFNLNIFADVDLSLPVASGHYDIQIRQRKITLPNLEETKIYRAGSQALFGSNQTNYFLVWPHMVAFQITDSRIYYQTLGNIPAGLLRIFILSEALGILLHLRGFFMLHASAIQHKGQATVFLGTPGAGKSTTIAAFAKGGFHVLSDDLVAIAPTHPPTVLPSFAEIKIWKNTALGLGISPSDLSPAWEGKEKYIMAVHDALYEKPAYPLKKIKILTSPTDGYTATSPLLGPVELLKHFPLPHQLLSHKSLQNHFETSSLILSEAEISTLTRPESFQSLLHYVQDFGTL
ncbi:serine kinase [Lacihabitans lacunae]|uniref:Serine kinase n=1 Tax=Lacihabitans lacunae TaxID=1028214 RepID=A0ABV7Z4R1_9BACT